MLLIISWMRKLKREWLYDMAKDTANKWQSKHLSQASCLQSLLYSSAMFGKVYPVLSMLRATVSHPCETEVIKVSQVMGQKMLNRMVTCQWQNIPMVSLTFNIKFPVRKFPSIFKRTTWFSWCLKEHWMYSWGVNKESSRFQETCSCDCNQQIPRNP